MRSTFLTFVFLALVLVGSAGAQTATQAFRLDWQPNSTNEEGFFIYRDSVKAGQVGKGSKTYVDTVTGNWGQQFCWEVSAFNHEKVDGTGALQESAKSNRACNTIPVPSQPAPNGPSGLTSQALSPTQIRLSWADNSGENEPGGNEASFEIRKETWGPRSVSAIKVEADTQTHLDEGLRNNRTFCYRIRAIGGLSNSQPPSEFSNQSCSTTPRR